MGPCELMDLIGHDTNFAVTNSVYEANFYDKRYVPSLVQREMVDGGLLGRKSGRGFYRYPDGARRALPVAVHEAPATAREVTVHGDGADRRHLEQAATAALAPQGWGPARERASGWTGLAIDGARLVLTDGRTRQRAGRRAAACADVAVFDRPLRAARGAGHRAGLRRGAGRRAALARAGAGLAGGAGLRAAAAWPTRRAWWWRAPWRC